MVPLRVVATAVRRAANVPIMTGNARTVKACPARHASMIKYRAGHVYDQERSPSGLGRSPGKRVGVHRASWVRIPPSPPHARGRLLPGGLLPLTPAFPAHEARMPA